MPFFSGGGGGGTYTPPTDRGQYGGGTAVSIANTASAALTWGSRQFGSAVLNVTAQTAPTVVTAGVYAVSVVVTVQSVMTAGGHFRAFLEVDVAGDDPQVVTDAVQPGGGQPEALLSLTYYCPAGSAMLVTAQNFDGAAARDFALFAVVQRIT